MISKPTLTSETQSIAITIANGETRFVTNMTDPVQTLRTLHICAQMVLERALAPKSPIVEAQLVPAGVLLGQ